MSKATRTPAPDLLIRFLKDNQMEFVVRKQNVRYLEDNGILVDPPKVLVFYKDELPKQVSTPAMNGGNKITLPSKKNGR